MSWELDVPPSARWPHGLPRPATHTLGSVLERDDQIVGFAYGHALNLHPAYRWTVQTGIYIDGDHHRRGAGRELYTQLLDRLGERGYRRVLAGITQPNDASNAFHRSLGFREAGLYRRVEWKLDVLA